MLRFLPGTSISMTLIFTLVLTSTDSRAQYILKFESVDKTESFLNDTLKLQSKFANMQLCMNYVNHIPALLQAKGYASASVDSIGYDSTNANCVLYLGEPLRYTYINTDSLEGPLVQTVGINRKSKKPFAAAQFKQTQEKVLDYMENNGYPFARIELKDVRFASDSIYGNLKIEKGPLYKIDSIRNLGSGSISPSFLQQYLGIQNGSIYKKEKLLAISGKIRELPYLQEKQPWSLSLLGTGSILNVYLDTKKSSEVNVLLGLLPSNDQLANNKLLVTGEATINLKNALGGGEIIGVNWQQLQVKSPRLDLLFQQPYLFGSPFGMNFNFDLLKKDSSYVNVSLLIGAAYSVSSRQTGSVFIQNLISNLLTVDTFAVKSSRKLPVEADITSINLGVNYDVITTDYRFNPRKGNEFSVTASAGTKNIKKNNVIIKLVDDSDPSFNYNSLYDTFQLKSYQFRIRFKAAKYFPVSRVSTIKAALNGGWFESPNIFRNEMFQIGGYKILRGFDEESIFTTKFAVATAEYRYLVGQNSFLSAFSDFGLSSSPSEGRMITNNFIGAGVGMAFETKAGIFNISYAAGKRDDQKFNLRQSKIHLGYVNYF